MTERSLADKMGVTVQYINGLCTNRLPASVKKLREIADVLGIKWTELVKE